jgi:hypothetical protein
MINKSMKDQKGIERNNKVANQGNSPKPNELNGVQISTHIKISDPNTGKVLLQKRGDI